METFVVRVWLPDRPGALGAVASRIGSVRGDVIGVDILERGNGRAIDELVVQLPNSTLLPLLAAEISHVDGVTVEDIRPAAEGSRDPRLDALETAAVLVAATTTFDLVESLVLHAQRDFSADWVAVVDLEEAWVRAAVGPAPSAAWLEAFVEGSRSSAPLVSGDTGPDDVAWAPLPRSNMSLVLGRHGRPLRARERRQAAALARIADTRWSEVRLRDSRLSHPSATP